jgi:hypothetical protein
MALRGVHPLFACFKFLEQVYYAVIDEAICGTWLPALEIYSCDSLQLLSWKITVD